MPTLILENGREHSLPGLGQQVPLLELSEKRVTKAVRDCLRAAVGDDRVEVSCEATINGSEWTGLCRIDGRDVSYRVVSS